MKLLKISLCLYLILLVFIDIGLCENQTLKVDLDLDEDGIKERITLINIPVSQIGGSFAEGFIEVESIGKTFRSEDIILEFSNDSYIKIIKPSVRAKSFIGLFNPGGMHGLSLTLFSFDGTSIKEEFSIFSDAPSIEIKDIDNDGVEDIISFSRDYENNPVEDSFIKTYKYRNNKWQLVSVYRTKTKQEVITEWTQKELIQ